jgi:hypothetical protein
MDATRVDALLRGRVPVSAEAPGLGAAYAAATRALLSGGGDDATASLAPDELPAMLLASGAALRRLGVQMLGAMEAGGAEGEAALLAAGAAGVLPPLVAACAALVARADAALAEGPALPPELLADLDCAGRALLFLMDPDCYAKLPSVALGGYAALGALVARAAHFSRRAVERAARAARESSTGGAGGHVAIALPPEVAIAGRLMRAGARAYLESTGHLTPEALAALDAAIAEEGVAAAIYAVLSHIPRTPTARMFCLVLGNGTGIITPEHRFASQCAREVASLVEAIASTSHSVDTLEMLATTLSNLVRRFPDAPRTCVEAGALRFLQPSLMGEPSRTVLFAAFAITSICRSDAAAEPERGNALRLVSSVLRSVAPGCIAPGGYEMDPIDEEAALLCEPGVEPALQLALLQIFCMALSGGTGDSHNKSVLGRSDSVARALRMCVASRDAFVYAAAAFVLRKLGLAVPFSWATRAAPPPRAQRRSGTRARRPPGGASSRCALGWASSPSGPTGAPSGRASCPARCSLS